MGLPIGVLIAQERKEASGNSIRLREDSESVSLRPNDPPTFLRLAERAGQPEAMQVAVTRYESPNVGGATVDLVSAVHIGEATYYRQLNELFATYDVVLYELVAEEGTIIPKGGKRDGGKHPIAVMQDCAKGLLGLHSQLEQIDYTKKNFVRADMTPAQMAAKMEERGDTTITVALSALTDVLRQQNLAARQSAEGLKDTAQPLLDRNIDLADLLGNPLKLKQTLGKQLALSGSLDRALGNTLNQMLVTDRNAAAAKVLQQQLASGKKRIAIFYGVAHMPDFHKRLVDDFGLQATSVRWLTAWDLTRSSGTVLDNPLSLFFRLLETSGQ